MEVPKSFAPTLYLFTLPCLAFVVPHYLSPHLFIVLLLLLPCLPTHYSFIISLDIFNMFLLLFKMEQDILVFFFFLVFSAFGVPLVFPFLPRTWVPLSPTPCTSLTHYLFLFL